MSHGRPLAVDPEEPERVAVGVARLGLQHVVVTSVDRDDLPDGGAAHFAATSATNTGDIDHLVEIPKRRRRVSDAPPEPEEPETPVRTLADARAAREAQQQLEDELLGNQEEIDAAMAALSPEKARALASELADLGTEAADAVAAAARAATPEERAAALKGVLTDEHGEPINRGLLLKFLSSVRS